MSINRTVDEKLLLQGYDAPDEEPYRMMLIRVKLSDYAKQKKHYDYICIGHFTGNTVILSHASRMIRSGESATEVELVRGNMINHLDGTSVPFFKIAPNGGNSGSFPETSEDSRIVKATYIPSDTFIYIKSDTLPDDPTDTCEFELMIGHYNPTRLIALRS